VYFRIRPALLGLSILYFPHTAYLLVLYDFLNIGKCFFFLEIISWLVLADIAVFSVRYKLKFYVKRLPVRQSILCLTASSNHTSKQPFTYANQMLLSSFRHLMMGGVSPETCWVSYKYGIINFVTFLHLVGSFCMNFTILHGSTNTNI
jgi:hypothetical protein